MSSTMCDWQELFLLTQSFRVEAKATLCIFPPDDDDVHLFTPFRILDPFFESTAIGSFEFVERKKKEETLVTLIRACFRPSPHPLTETR